MSTTKIQAPAHSAIAGHSMTAFKISLFSTLGFSVLLALLHVIKPDVDPSWHFISEYAIGSNGWMMSLAFLLWTLGFMSMAVGYRKHVRSIPGTIAMILLIVSAVGTLLGGLFTTDPITTSPENMTTTGGIHALGGALGMAIPLAIVLVTWTLLRSQGWKFHKRALLLFAGLAFLGFAYAFISLGMMHAESGGVFGPDVHVGWPNRIEVLGYCIWMFVVARTGTKIPAA